MHLSAAMVWLDDPVTAAAALPVVVLPLFIFASAALEYLVPPYWGDMFVLAGFFLARQGAISPALLFVAAVAGSLAGALGAYLIGRRYGLRIAHRVTPGSRRGRAAERMRALLRRFGERVLVANRFLPFVRGLMLYGAGGMQMRLTPVVLYTTISNLFWVGLLMAVGTLSAETFEEIQQSFRHASRWIGIGVAVVVGVWLALALRRARAAEPS